MMESLKSFFDTLPVNHWSSILIAVLAMVFIIYPIYFYFSKEGKDERGKKIISTASFLSFVSTLIILFIFYNFFYNIIRYSDIAYFWISNFIIFLISGVQTFSILILRKLN